MRLSQTNRALEAGLQFKGLHPIMPLFHLSQGSHLECKVSNRIYNCHITNVVIDVMNDNSYWMHLGHWCPRTAAVISHYINTLTNFLFIFLLQPQRERVQKLVASEAFNLSLIGLIHFNERSHMERFHSKSLRIHLGFHLGWQPKVRTR